MSPQNAGHFTVCVDVAVSRSFISWVFSLGSGARIIEPENVVMQVKEEIKRLVEEYQV